MKKQKKNRAFNRNNESAKSFMHLNQRNNYLMIAERRAFALSSIYVNYNTLAHNQISRIILKKDRLENQKCINF
ncbi:hypothetical protein [Staphylococcus caeli]|uniref:Uncharacterized protein n=1 Tax=Staphylococcus caeli TaxID=2201815 RepID=A0A1D4RG76_9STAP|nr:hypothetical protein [Staphylococcus caeli]SCT42659.1 Uncharacterised protein [Staphylococcus caeli]SCT46531.1 Uncharacterised protein [Staphylococcus caeli]